MTFNALYIILHDIWINYKLNLFCMQLKWYLGNNPSSIPLPCCKRQFTPSRKCQYTTNTNNYAKWDNNIFYIFVLSKFCKNNREKKNLILG